MEKCTRCKKDKTPMEWKVDTANLLKEIHDNSGQAILHYPINVFRELLTKVADRAIKINDLKLDRLMFRLGLYESSQPDHKDHKRALFALGYCVCDYDESTDEGN